jgi:hypothetical protein
MKKILILAVLIGLYTAASCQQEAKKHFVRVYNIEGKKIAKGFIASQTESTLTILKNTKTVQINMSDVSKIKNGRSAGHYIFIGSIAVIVPLTIAVAVCAASFALSGPMVFTFAP